MKKTLLKAWPMMMQWLFGNTLDNMSFEQAMEFSNNGNFETFMNHYSSLSSRPDWDGHITLSEANDW